MPHLSCAHLPSTHNSYGLIYTLIPLVTNSSSNTIERFTRHEEGDNGVIITNQRLVKEYREIIVAIDEDIINEVGKLFMAIY